MDMPIEPPHGEGQAPVFAIPEWLSPVQKTAYQRLLTALDSAPIVALHGENGTGKSTLLKTLAEQTDGTLLQIADIIHAVRPRDTMACGDGMLVAIEQAFLQSDVVLLDGSQIMLDYTLSGDTTVSMLEALLAERPGRRFVMAGVERLLDWQLGNAQQRVRRLGVETLGMEDYTVILENLLGGGRLAQVDMDLVWRQASALDGHELRTLAGLLSDLPRIETRDVLALLGKYFIAANVKTQEVEQLSFGELPGSEEIAARLETHVLLPLEQPELARELKLKPKRGVLLYGPPGTGKTSIGRALAHRMKGRFFLIDGSFQTEPPYFFFSRVQQVVREARENAPCVLFVDDADVLFGIPHIAGFARYLLSLLDGVESEGAENVCLMMTAMNAGRIPGSVLRSGRVELWLETHHPDAATREAIFARWMDNNVPGTGTIDFPALAAITDGFTPADIRRIVGDVRSLHAMDHIGGKPELPAQTYFERAVARLIDIRAKMADNLDDESLRIASLTDASGLQTTAKRGKYGAGIGGIVEVVPGSVPVMGW
jgi:transitional endoplasmic reticulum ATPase